MRLLLAIALSACYDPSLERCTVHCTVGGASCPDAMTCESDGRCHDPDDTQACPADNTFTLSVDAAGTGSGLVTAMPDINCPPTCDEVVTGGTSVSLSASANAGSRFVSWGGACAGSDASCAVTVTADETVGANFNLLETITVEFEGQGGGDVFAIDPADFSFDCNVADAPCAVEWDQGASVTLSAQPDGESAFEGWDGDCAAATGTTCTFALTGPITAIAIFN